MDQLDLLIQGHLRNHHVGALIRRQRFIHPGALDFRLLGTLRARRLRGSLSPGKRG
jgi:hypothetical protein